MNRFINSLVTIDKALIQDFLTLPHTYYMNEYMSKTSQPMQWYFQFESTSYGV